MNQANQAIVTCTCGAFYERSEHASEEKESGQFICQVCGTVLATWTSTHVPTFTLIAEEGGRDTPPQDQTQGYDGNAAPNGRGN